MQRSLAPPRRSWQFLACWLAVGALPVAAQSPLRVLPDGKQPADRRLEPLKDLNGYFPFHVPDSVDKWKQRAAFVRRQMRVALGLLPEPTRTPLHAVVFGKRDMGDYMVAKVVFQSMPGFYVTGNLYRPKNKSAKHPGVLCPHGHWSNGRFHDADTAGVRRQIVNGAERFEDGGRSPLQSRCVQLARMGCVVFHYDMLGYADSVQLSFQVTHRFAKQRPDAISPTDWGLFSPQAESHLQSVMGLQAWNSIRSVDFLLSLPDVDPNRLAVTGASGGGTQTFILSALDPRIAVSMPCVMVSTAMQGGCTCENACLLRVGTGNVEFAALFAPKPLGLTAANDWTKEMPTKGFPQLQALYRLVGAPDHVMLAALTHFGHNYNYVSRARMYSWFNRHLKLGLPEPIVEEDYHRLGRQELTVWDGTVPKPTGEDVGDAFEKRLLKWWAGDVQTRLKQLSDGGADDWNRYRRTVEDGLAVVLGGHVPDRSDAFDFEDKVKRHVDGVLLVAGLLRDKEAGTENPVGFLIPENWNGRVVIWLGRRGKNVLLDGARLDPQIKRLVDQGVSVAAIDLFQQGEFLPPGMEELEQTRRVNNPRQAAAYTFGYNRALVAHRVHDVQRLIGFIRTHQRRPKEVWLVAVDGMVPVAAGVLARSAASLDGACIDTHGFRFINVTSIRSPDFLPGGSRYGDLPGMLALAAPRPMWLAGETPAGVELVERAYRKAGKVERLTRASLPEGKRRAAAVDWLLRP